MNDDSQRAEALAGRERFVGSAMERREDPSLVTGDARYTDDISVPGTTHLAFVRSQYGHAEVTEIEQTGMADRVCIDTGSLMDDSEGMLVGSMSRGLFFVHAETAESPYVASRPFRVNAGAVHAYVRTPDGGTKYLSELKSGDEVQIVDSDGKTREAVVGRVKIEKRPMFRVEAEIDGDRVETLLQNAETIKVPTREGRKSVTDLEAGDEVRLFYEQTARHFGEAVEESIIEK